MRELILDASTWRSPKDVYDAFFKAVGAPEWHGRNFDALIDSIETGSINAIEVPYRVVIKNYDSVAEGARKMTSDFVHLINEIRARGCDIEIRTEK